MQWDYGKSAGRWYWEVQVESVGYDVVVGVGLASTTTSGDPHLSNILPSSAYASAFGFLFAGYRNYGEPFAAGDVISVLVDLEAHQLRFWRNGRDQGLANATDLGAGSEMFPMAWINDEGDRASVNFGPRFAFVPPAGYGALR
jgi:hypothetical protein